MEPTRRHRCNRRVKVLLVVAATLVACSQAVRSPAVEGASPAPCAPAPGQTELISQLAVGGIKVTQMASSKLQPFIGASAVVCYVKTPNAAFEAAFFTDASVAKQLRVCESRSASRYLYRVNGETMDAAYPVYWSRSGTVVLWTNDLDLDRSLRTALSPVSIPC